MTSYSSSHRSRSTTRDSGFYEDGESRSTGRTSLPSGKYNASFDRLTDNLREVADSRGDGSAVFGVRSKVFRRGGGPADGNTTTTPRGPQGSMLGAVSVPVREPAKRKRRVIRASAGEDVAAGGADGDEPGSDEEEDMAWGPARRRKSRKKFNESPIVIRRKLSPSGRTRVSALDAADRHRTPALRDNPMLPSWMDESSHVELPARRPRHRATPPIQPTPWNTHSPPLSASPSEHLRHGPFNSSTFAGPSSRHFEQQAYYTDPSRRFEHEQLDGGGEYFDRAEHYNDEQLYYSDDHFYEQPADLAAQAMLYSPPPPPDDELEYYADDGVGTLEQHAGYYPPEMLETEQHYFDSAPSNLEYEQQEGALQPYHRAGPQPFDDHVNHGEGPYLPAAHHFDAAPPEWAYEYERPELFTPVEDVHEYGVDDHERGYEQGYGQDYELEQGHYPQTWDEVGAPRHHLEENQEYGHERFRPSGPAPFQHADAEPFYHEDQDAPVHPFPDDSSLSLPLPPGVNASSPYRQHFSDERRLGEGGPGFAE